MVNSFKLNCKIKPNSNRNQIKTVEDDLITIEVSKKNNQIKAQPENNKANLELIKFMKKILNLDSDEIKLISGHKSTNKCLEIYNKSKDEIYNLLNKNI